MFISNEDAEKRIKDSDFLTRINKPRSERVPSPRSAPPEPKKQELDPEEAENARIANKHSTKLEDLLIEPLEMDETPEGEVLRKMLGLRRSGTREGIGHIPLEIRAGIATTDQLTTARNAGAVWGVHRQHADQLGAGFSSAGQRYYGTDNPIGPDGKLIPGLVSGHHEANKELLAEINLQKKSLRDVAFSRLMKSLGLITDERLEALTDVVKLTRVTRDLSTVYDKAIPREELASGNNGVHFHVWRPEMRAEDAYEVINLNPGVD